MPSGHLHARPSLNLRSGIFLAPFPLALLRPAKSLCDVTRTYDPADQIYERVERAARRVCGAHGLNELLDRSLYPFMYVARF